MKDKFSNERIIEVITTISILGEISNNNIKDIFVFAKINTSLVAELFLLIWSNSQFTSMEKENRVILFTSS